MAILNFMPQFAPWYTKVLLKKKDDPDAAAAKEPSTGFFGDVFDFIDDGFNWAATAPVAEDVPPQYYEEPTPAYEVPPQYYEPPAPSYEPTGGFGAGIGDIFNGSGEGMGFDMISQPTDNWASQYPAMPSTDWGWDSEMGGGMGFDPPSFDPMPAPARVPDPSWSNPFAGRDITPSTFDSWDFSQGFPANLANAHANDNAWADVQDLRNGPLDNWDTSETGYLPQSSAPIVGALDTPDPMGWGDISSMFNEARTPPPASSWNIPGMETSPRNWDDISAEYDYANPVEPAPQTWDIPGTENQDIGRREWASTIPGWYSMSPDERGEYVWQSGLQPEAYLSDMDIASLSPDVRFKLNFSDNERNNQSNAGFLGDIGKAIWDTSEGAWNQTAQLGMDAFYDPINGQLDPSGITSLRPNAQGNLSQLTVPEQQTMLDDTIANARDFDVSNPLGSSWDFLSAQNDDYKERPLAEQLMGQVFVPGNGLFGSVDDLPRALALLESGADFAQGGKLLGALGDIPGAGSFAKNVLLPGGVGAAGGALTEAIADPKYTYTDPITGETKTINPNYLEMMGLGAGTAVLGNQAIKRGLLPGNSIEDVSKNLDEFGNLINETPQEKLIRLQREVFASDPTAAAPFSTPGAVSPSIADEGLSTVPSETAYVPPKKMTAAQKKLPIAEQRAILGEPPATNQQGYLTWIDENNRINALEAATPEWRAKNIETITPANDTVIGKNDLGEDVYERANDGLRYTIRDGRVRTGGNLAVVEDEGLSTIPTGIADEAVTPAPSTPLVERAVNHVDAILRDRAMTAAERRTEFVKRNSDILAAQQDALGDAAGEDAARAILKGERMDVFAPEVPRLTEAQGAELRDLALAKARQMGYGNVSSYQITDAIRSLVDGTNANPSELRTLRNVLTDTPYQKAADTIETVVPKADEIIRRPNARIVDDAIEPGMDGPLSTTLDEISTAKLAPEDEAIIGADDALFPEFKPSGIERTNINDRGSFQTSLGNVDETGQYRSPGTPIIGEDESLVRRQPLWGEADKATRPDEYPFTNTQPNVQPRTPNEVVKAVDAWQADMVERGRTMQPEALNRFLDEELAKFTNENGSDVASMAKIARAKIPGQIQKQSLAGWQAPFNEAMPSGVPTDIPTESGALVSKRAAEMADVPPSTMDSVPAVIKSAVEEWEQKALNAVKGLPMTKRADELDKMQLELSRTLRGQVPDGTAVSQAERSRERVVYALNRQDKAEMDAGLADWRETNTKDFDAIDVNAKSSWAERRVGGALKNKLADTLTSRGRDLDMYFQKQGYTFEESKDMVERELGDYLNGRMVREAKNGNKDAILEHALTALHMGDFQPKMDGVKVPTGTGQVPGALQTARTANAALKNMFFGIADVGAIMGNAVPAIMNQGPMVGLAYLNRIAKLVDIDDALKNREFSGLAMDQSQDVMSEDVGTLIGWAGRALGDKKGGAALRAIDKPFTKWNDVLSKAQFDLLMNKGLRQPAYEGNLVLLKLLGRDVNDPSLQRAAARMANASTSTAPLARGNTRRAAEGATLSSARYLRAQGDLLLAATKLINPKASLDERIIAASAIASVIAVSAAANELAGNRLDLNPFKGVNINPLKGDIDIKGAEFNPDFGKITLPDGTVIPFFRQKELAQTLLKTVAELDDLVKKDPTGIRDAWSRFIIGRTGPLGGTALKGLAKTGYDPVENTYSFPWEGEGFGSGMSPTQYALQMLPVPVGITGLLNSEGSNTSKGLNFIGGGTYPQGEYSAALKKYGVSSMEEFEKLDPDTFMTRKEKLYQENPELRAKFADSASAKIAESKVANSEKFMETKQMVGDWRETKDDLANQAKGAYNELGLEEKERPSTPGSAQWLWDYNNTFKAALEDLNNSSSEMNDEILGKLQADFWAKHPDPKVRKEILQYQILRAPTEADKLYARDMARLNGFDPDTGETLKIPGTDQPMPNYFNMDRYFWTEVPNDEAKQFDTKFDKWKLKQSDKVRDLTRAKQIDLYLATEDEVATRFNGKEWTPAAIKDVKNYGLPSKEDPIYSEYKQIMLPELLWFKPEQYWDNIKEAHDNRE